MAMKKAKLLQIWIHAGEYIASCLFYIICFIFFDRHSLSLFIIKTSEHWLAKFIYIMLTTSIAFFWVFYKQSESNFCKWLYKKNSYDTYIKVFLSAIAIYFLTSVLLIATAISKNNIISYITGWFIILSIINVFTFFSNIVGLMKLNTFFNIKLDETKK